MRKPIIVGNWKLNKTISVAVEFITAVEPLLHDDADFGVATSYLALQASVQNAKRLIIAAQNVNENDSGAFTGEVSVGMLKEERHREIELHMESVLREAKNAGMQSEEIKKMFLLLLEE